MNDRLITVTLCLTTGVAGSAGAQTCNPAIQSSTPESRYQINSDGTATDRETGLMWQRCAEGMDWDGVGCSGGAIDYTWSQALQQAANANQQGDLGYRDWRLPNKNELASLVEVSCVGPAINLSVFPNTPNIWFWSSSPLANNPGHAWGVNFGSGDVRIDSKNSYDSPVRLVRAGQAFASLPDNETPPAEPALASGSFAEPSDTPEQAVPILVNDTPQHQLLDDRGGDDWFEFYAEQGTRYTLQIPADSIGSAIHPGLELYDTSGNLLETANYAGSAAETQIVWRATATELFRLRVFDQGLAARKANPALDYAYQMRVFLTYAPQQGLIKGFVRDACQQIGINKAAVSAWSGGALRDSSFTHKTGEFGIPVDPGAYDVKGSANQYQERQRNVSVAQVQASRADFDLSPQSSCEQITQTKDPVLQSQQAVATYDEQTGLLIIKDVWAKGYTYYAELQDIGGYRFQLMDAIPLSGTIHAPTGAYSFDTLQADFPSVYAFGKTFKVQMQNDGNWLFDLTHASEAE